MWPQAPAPAPREGGRPRFGQLTYSSFDRNDGAGGGWQVKQTVGDIDEAEAGLLSSRVQTQLDTGSELPKFPTTAEIEELPRKMTHAFAGGGAGTVERATWHVCPAGNDASGRPGNVFAHVVLDRMPDPTEVLRPVERWRSEQWLTPFGPEQVLAAQLASTEPPTDGPVDRRTISTWLFAPRKWRFGLLTVLLDGVLASLRDLSAPRVVLAVDDVDEAANWIAAVSLCMSAGTSRNFCFSTLERDSTLAEAWKLGVQLACIPRGDLPGVAKPRHGRPERGRQPMVVLDSDEQVVLGDLGGTPHQTARGDQITVTEWSVLAAELFSDAKSFVDAVGLIDRVAAQVGDMGLDPVWPAAMVMAQRAGTDVGAEVNRVLARHSPPQVRDHPQLYAAALASMHGMVGGDPGRAWQQVVDGGASEQRGGEAAPPGERPAGNPPTVMGEVAVRVYAELALASEQWLAAPGPTRLPATDFYSEWPDPDLVAAARRLVPEISTHHEQLPDPVMLAETRAGLGFLELCLRLGLAHDEGLRRELLSMTEATLVPTLLRADLADRLLELIAGGVSTECRHWVWPVLQHTDLSQLGAPGRRLPPRVLATFGPSADDPDPVASARPDGAGLFAPLVTELAWTRVRTTPDPDAAARLVCVWSWLAEQQPPEQVTALLAPAWPAPRLEVLLRRFGPAVPEHWLLPTLLSTDDAPGLWQLIAGSGGTGTAAELAQLRLRLASENWLEPSQHNDSGAVAADGTPDAGEALAPSLRLLAGTHQQARQHFGDVELAPSLARRGRLLLACAVIASERVDPGWSHLLAGGPAYDTAEEAEVVRWCRGRGIGAERLGTLLLKGDPRSPLNSSTDGATTWLAGVHDRDENPLVGSVLGGLLQGSAEESERVAADLLALARTAEGTADPQRARQTEKYLSGFVRKAQSHGRAPLFARSALRRTPGGNDPAAERGEDHSTAGADSSRGRRP